MKLSTLKSAERALWRLREIYLTEAKSCAAAKLKYEEANQLWMSAHDAWKARVIELARQRDKGKVLWVVFTSARHHRLEVTRTPNLLITRHIFPDSWVPGGERVCEPHVETRLARFDNSPDRDLNYYLRQYHTLNGGVK